MSRCEADPYAALPIRGRPAISSLLELFFTALGLLAELVVSFVAWLIRPLTRAMRASLPARSKAPSAAATPRRPPQDALDAVVAALQAEGEAGSALSSGWRGLYMGISSDSEEASEILIGAELRLVFEPDHPDKDDAVRIEADLPNRATIQIGYLRRGHKLERAVAGGRACSWLAGRRRTLRAGAWETVIFVAIYDP